MTLHVILAESALELVPGSLRGHPAVRSHARRLGRDPSDMLLDVSWHYGAMKQMPDAQRRGRPDLVHFAILSATATPLYRAGLARLYVHTVQDAVVRFSAHTRIPKSYHRFEGLFAQLLRQGSVRSEGETLLEAAPSTVRQLVESIRPTGTAGLSVRGSDTMRDALAGLGDEPCVVIGGFQRGGFGEATAEVLDCTCRMSPQPLESHVVMSRLLYDMERAGPDSALL